MSIRKTRSQINFSVPHDTQLKMTLTAFSQRISPPGVKQTFTYANQVMSEHNRSALVKVIPDVNGWRRPAPYRVFAAKVKRWGYSYEYTQGSSSFRVWSDSTDNANGWGASSYLYWGTKLSGGLRVPDVPTSLETQVIAEAKLKLQNGDLNLLTSLGEAKETVNMIATFLVSAARLTAKALTRTPKTVRVHEDVYYAGGVGEYSRRKVSKDFYLLSQGRLRTPVKVDRLKRTYDQIVRGKIRFMHADGYVDQAEQVWLQTMYGVLPLIADIQAFAVAAKQKLLKSGAQVNALRTVMQNGGLPSRPVGFARWETAGTYRFGAECDLRYRMVDSHANFLAALGLDNPFGLFWELTPYSFVVDWLVPIGNMLQALTADVGLSFESGYVNTKSYCDFAVACCVNPGAIGTIPTIQYTNVCQNRYTLVTSPITGLYFKSPFSTPHVVSAIALVTQLARSVR